jgi:hypothetical protein
MSYVSAYSCFSAVTRLSFPCIMTRRRNMSETTRMCSRYHSKSYTEISIRNIHTCIQRHIETEINSQKNILSLNDQMHRGYRVSLLCSALLLPRMYQYNFRNHTRPCFPCACSYLSLDRGSPFFCFSRLVWVVCATTWPTVDLAKNALIRHRWDAPRVRRKHTWNA